MRIVWTDRAPAPAGHYSQAVVHGGVVYVAGQLARDPDPPRDVRAQTRHVLDNLSEILEAAGSGLDRLLQVTVYVTDPSEWGTINEVFAETLGAHRPARAMIPVATLPRGSAIEIVAIAATRDEL